MTLFSADLNVFASLCEELEEYLSQCYGPCGLSRLINTSTAKTIITNSGETIINSLQVDHPICKMITTCALNHCSKTGDGSKTFVVFLSKLLRGLSNISKKHSQQTNFIRISLFNAIDKFFKSVFHKYVIPSVIIKCNSELQTNHMKNIIFSSLNSRFPVNLVQRLTNVVWQALTFKGESLECSDLKNVLISLIEDFDNVCVESADEPPEMTRLEEMIIISRNYLSLHKSLSYKHSPDEKNISKFVLLKLDLTSNELPDCLVIKNSDKASTFLQFTSNNYRSFVKDLVTFGIDLLMSTGRISESLNSWCSAYRISTVQCVPEEEIDRLGRIFLIHPLTSLSDVKLEDMSLFTAHVKDYGQVVVNGRQFVYLQGCTEFLKKLKKNETVFPFQIMVCGYSFESCQDMSLDLKKSLKQLNSCLVPLFKEPDCVAGINDDCRNENDFQQETSFSSSSLNKIKHGLLTSPTSDQKLTANPLIEWQGIFLPGRAAFEIEMYSAINDFLKMKNQTLRNEMGIRTRPACGDEDFSEMEFDVCKVVMDSILAIPQLLVTNSYASNIDKQRPLAYRIKELNNIIISNNVGIENHEIYNDDVSRNTNVDQERTTRSHYFHAVNCRSGKLEISNYTTAGSYQNSIVEPIRGKIELIHDVFRITQQLLRLEAIVPIVRKAKKTNADYSLQK